MVELAAIQDAKRAHWAHPNGARLIESVSFVPSVVRKSLASAVLIPWCCSLVLLPCPSLAAEPKTEKEPPPEKIEPAKLADRPAQVRDLAQPLAAAGVVQSLAIGVIHNGERHVFVLGTFSASDPRTPDAQSVYEIGSVTKVFTALALADMVEERLVTLSTPANELLPPKLALPEFEGQPITLADLATHSSALPRLPDNLKPADPLNPYADYTQANLADFLKTCKLSRAPREKVEYSNLGAGVLGLALAAREGTTYEELIQKRIAGPLGMKETVIGLSADQVSRFVPGHTIGQEPQPAWDLPTFAGAGALRSTLNDMLRFAEAQISPPDDRLGLAITASHAKIHEITEDLDIGLGWHILRDGQRPWHNGETGGFHTFVGVDLDQKTAVVILCNTAEGVVDGLGFRALDLLRGEAVDPITVRKPTVVAEEVLDKLAGRYQLAPLFVLTITRRGTRLGVQATGQGEIGFYPESETDFFCRLVDAKLTFEMDDEGHVKAVVLHQGGRDSRGERLSD